MTDRDQAAVFQRPFDWEMLAHRIAEALYVRTNASSCVEGSGRRISSNLNRETGTLRLDPVKTGRPVLTGYVFRVLDSIMVPFRPPSLFSILWLPD